MSTHISKSSRRTFLSGAAATSAYVWIPKPVRGYTTAEVLATITLDNKVKPGTSKWELDTPALCVDLDKMERNIAKMQASVKANGIASRPHTKTHKCAAIAKYQLATGSIGICCAKVSEAEAMLENGVEKVCMTTSNPSRSKIRRAMAIRKRSSSFIQAVDLEENARDLSAAAKEAGPTTSCTRRPASPTCRSAATCSWTCSTSRSGVRTTPIRTPISSRP